MSTKRGLHHLAYHLAYLWLTVGLPLGCRLDAIRLEAVFQTPTSHCTAHFETKERKPGGRHAQSKKVGLKIFDEIAKAVVSPLFHPSHCNIFKPPDIAALLFCKFYTFVKK